MLFCAVAVAALTFIIHTFVGGRYVAAPLLADASLPRASKWLSYYCWHIATVLIAAIAAGLLWLALVRTPAVTAPGLVFFCSLTAALSALSAGVALKGGIHPMRFPSTTLFALTSVFCWLALVFPDGKI